MQEGSIGDEASSDEPSWLEEAFYEARDVYAQEERAYALANARWYSTLTCVSPNTAYWVSRARDSITFDKNKSATKIGFPLPCGRCIGCKQEYARQWGIRCMHEKKMWSHSVFVTLTYNDEFLPPYGSLCLRDWQLFMKRLRKNVGGVDTYVDPDSQRALKPVRFFMGAEYGDTNFRPHYHAILFNCRFSDARQFTTYKGNALYRSTILDNLWSVDGKPMGYCTIGEVTFDSAVYCAKYALKRLTLTDSSPPEIRRRYEEKYLVVDEFGEVHQREREFSCKSLRPGIGGAYYEKYGAEVRAHDSVVINGREVRPPRYYDNKTAEVDPEVFERMKRRRKREGVLAKPDNTPERLRVKEKLMQSAAEKKERNL